MLLSETAGWVKQLDDLLTDNAGENHGDRNQEQQESSKEYSGRIVGVLKGKHTQVSAHWVWCQFGVVSGRLDSEWLEGACFWMVSWLQVTSVVNQNSGDCDRGIVVAGDWGDWSESLTHTHTHTHTHHKHVSAFIPVITHIHAVLPSCCLYPLFILHKYESINGSCFNDLNPVTLVRKHVFLWFFIC